MSRNPAVHDTPPPASSASLRWQCRRGMLELDLLLNRFLDTVYETLPGRQQQVFLRLLAYPDQTLHELLLSRMVSADRDIAALVERIRDASGA